MASAQSGIAGSVKDTTGAMLPGVTVEVTSSALIENVRTVVTDDKGEYKVIDLVTGTYTVTFTVPGFSPVKREGIELTAAFTGRLQQGYAAMVVGVYLAPSLQDVGGAKGETVSGLQIHNSRQGQKADLFDGIPFNSTMGAGGGASGLKINMGAVQEIALGLSGNSPEFELGETDRSAREA